MIDSRDNLPPHNSEAEKVILGICFLEPSLVSVFSEKGLDRMFYDLRNQVVFRAMVEIKNQGLVPDTVTVHSHLKTEKDFHFDYFLELVNSVDSVHNHEYWFGLIEEAFLARRVCQVCSELLIEARGCQDVSKLVSKAQTEILGIGVKTSKRKGRHEQFHEMIACMEDFQKGIVEEIGLPTGYMNLDRFFPMGFSNGQLIVIAGRPGMGKSTLALNILENMAMKGKPVGFLSLEMSELELNYRTVARLSEVPTTRVFRRGGMDQETGQKVALATITASKLPIHVELLQDSDIKTVRAAGRRIRAEKKAECIVVDYIQRLRTSGRSSNRNGEIEEITGNLKDMAVELGIPVIACSQFNREVEKQERRPKLSDLRDGGSIEQDCDKAILLYQEKEMDDRLITAIIGKNRAAERGEAKLYFKKEINHFQDYKESPFNAP